MISDEPDEDADELDDEKALERYLGAAGDIDAAAAPDGMPDWPPGYAQGQAGGLNVDMSTIAWFKTNYIDWQQEIGSVLRGWIVAKTRGDQDTQTLG